MRQWGLIACLVVVTGCPTKKPQAICGNGVHEPGEACDPGEDGDTCVDLGFDGGDELRCNADCQGYDTSVCQLCGNGVREGNEVCDAGDFGSESCETRGFDSGVLSCKGCQFVETTSCGKCGNNTIDGDEACDANALAEKKCTDFGGASGPFDGGVLRCQAGCAAFDLTQCAYTLPTCGDGSLNGLEVCDGPLLDGKTCESEGFDPGGVLACANTCTVVDPAGCQKCGNDAREGSEACDGVDLALQTCETRGYSPGGALGCAPGCAAFDVSGCFKVVINEVESVIPTRTVVDRSRRDRIELYNLGPATADLSGWRLDGQTWNFQGAPHPYTFPDGTTLAAGAVMSLDRCEYSQSPASPGGEVDPVMCAACNACGSITTTCANGVDAGDLCCADGVSRCGQDRSMNGGQNLATCKNADCLMRTGCNSCRSTTTTCTNGIDAGDVCCTDGKSRCGLDRSGAGGVNFNGCSDDDCTLDKIGCNSDATILNTGASYIQGLTPCSPRVGIRSDTRDDVRLYDPNATIRTSTAPPPDPPRDRVEIPRNVEGISIGRYPDGSGELQTLAVQTFGAPNIGATSTCGDGQVTLAEVCDPSASSPLGVMADCYNQTAVIAANCPECSVQSGVRPGAMISCNDGCYMVADTSICCSIVGPLPGGVPASLYNNKCFDNSYCCNGNCVGGSLSPLTPGNCQPVGKDGPCAVDGDCFSNACSTGVCL